MLKILIFSRKFVFEPISFSTLSKRRVKVSKQFFARQKIVFGDTNLQFVAYLVAYFNLAVITDLHALLYNAFQLTRDKNQNSYD